MQLLVLGMHRSGTSLVTRLLNLMGASLGPPEYIVAPDERNPTGYWERADVFAIDEDLLKATGRTWDRPDGFDPAAAPAEALDIFRARAKAIVGNLNPHQPWVMKDPRLCLLLPLWRPLLTSPLAVVAYRNPLDVAQSLNARDGIPLSRGLALWEIYTRAAMAATGDLPRVVVSYDDLLDSPAAAARRAFTQLAARGARDLVWPDVRSPADFVDSKLRHHHAPQEETERILTGPQRELYAALRGAVTVEPSGL